MKSIYCLLFLSFGCFLQQTVAMEDKMPEKLVVFEHNPQLHPIDGYRDLETLEKLEGMAKKSYDNLSKIAAGWFTDEAFKTLKEAKKQRMKSVIMPSTKTSEKEVRRIAKKSSKKEPLFVSKQTLAALVQFVQFDGGYIKLWLRMPGLPHMNVQLIDKYGNSMHIDGPILEAAAAAQLPPFNQ